MAQLTAKEAEVLAWEIMEKTPGEDLKIRAGDQVIKVGKKYLGPGITIWRFMNGVRGVQAGVTIETAEPWMSYNGQRTVFQSLDNPKTKPMYIVHGAWEGLLTFWHRVTTKTGETTEEGKLAVDFHKDFAQKAIEALGTDYEDELIKFVYDAKTEGLKIYALEKRPGWFGGEKTDKILAFSSTGKKVLLGGGWFDYVRDLIKARGVV